MTLCLVVLQHACPFGGRLEALSVDQGGDIARLEASLQTLRGSSATPTAAAAAAAGVSSLGDSGRGDLGGCAQEESAQTAAGLKAEDVSDPKLHSPAAAAAAVAPRGEGDQEGGVSKGGAGQGGRGSRDASPKRDIRTEWEVRFVVLRELRPLVCCYIHWCWYFVGSYHGLSVSVKQLQFLGLKV